jgi:outer membrane receptor for ferrienterochelin and colicin
MSECHFTNFSNIMPTTAGNNYEYVGLATLRGLSPDQVLVLFNGKRRHQSALVNLNGSVGGGSTAVNLNTIPPLAIERIEVLRKGAASKFGSDAIVQKEKARRKTRAFSFCTIMLCLF